VNKKVSIRSTSEPPKHKKGGDTQLALVAKTGLKNRKKHSFTVVAP
jgi:hypothetical protein